MTNNKLLYSGNNKCADCTHVNACMRMSIVFDYPFEEIAMYSDRCFAYEPTVEVVHGRWNPYKISDVFTHSCSVCHCDVNGKTPYCPYCGAKMDGGNEDG